MRLNDMTNLLELSLFSSETLSRARVQLIYMRKHREYERLKTPVLRSLERRGPNSSHSEQSLETRQR